MLLQWRFSIMLMEKVQADIGADVLYYIRGEIPG